MNFRVIFKNRDFTDRVVKPSMRLTVARFGFRAIGGPRRATITADGSVSNLWDTLEYLRCPVEIYDQYGRATWWGYVNEVNIKTKTKSATLFCNGWWDMIAWRYYLKATSATVETTTQISTAITGTCTAIAGVDIETASGISTVEKREGDRTALQEVEDLLKSGTINNKRLLAQVGINRRVRVIEEPTIGRLDGFISGDCEFGVSLDTMSNRVYAYYTTPGDPGRHNTATADDTTSQTEYGMKSLNLSLQAASATQANAYRDAALLRRKYPIPTIKLDGQTGVIKNNMGVEIQKYQCPVGSWLWVRDMISATADTRRIADASKIFVEEWEYDAGSGELMISPRDVPGPYDLTNVGGA